MILGFGRLACDDSPHEIIELFTGPTQIPIFNQRAMHFEQCGGVFVDAGLRDRFRLCRSRAGSAAYQRHMEYYCRNPADAL